MTTKKWFWAPEEPPINRRGRWPPINHGVGFGAPAEPPIHRRGRWPPENLGDGIWAPAEPDIYSSGIYPRDRGWPRKDGFRAPA